MLKLAAALCVIGGSTGLAFYVCREMKERIRHMQEWVKLLCLMKSEIAYGRITFEEACFNVSKRVQEPYRSFLLSVYKRMQSFTGEGLLSIWQNELVRIAKELSMKKEETNLLEMLVEEQGFLDGEMQILKMSRQIEEIEEKIKELKSKEENKSRVYLYLGIMGGILCTILFL